MNEFIFNILYFFHKKYNTKNCVKDEMTGRVENEVSGPKHIFWPISPKTVKIGAVLGTVTSIFAFLHFSQKYVDPSGHLILNEIYCSSNFFF